MAKFTAVILDWARMNDTTRNACVYGSGDKAVGYLWTFLQEEYATYKLEADSVEDVFYKLNIDHPADYKLRSMSVGDLVVDPEGVAWICASFGWKKLSEVSAQVAKVLAENLAAVDKIS